MTVCLLVTANVGSIFEDPNGLMKTWVKEFLQTIRKLEPKFIALHCQEFGGKNYETSMSYVSEFVRILLSSEELLEFEQIRVFLDEDFKANDKFTALGNLYLVHKSQEAHIWDFNDQLFTLVSGKEIHSGNIENVSIKDKLKFPQDFFPECKWSRKGFMRTRWLLNGVAFDLINIHLFHDESNFVSISEFPSPYSKNRRKALEYTLDLIATSTFKDIPQFLFGDLNFRLNLVSMVQSLINNARPTQILASNGDLSRLIYRDSHQDRHLMIERKHFLYSDQTFFLNRRNIDMMLELDKESSHFGGLNELKIDFPPSYPFKEEMASSGYMNTRCPAWCDRVLMNKFAHKLLLDNTSYKPKYEMMGLDVPMGDHKPVYLLFKLLPNREPNECEKRALTNLLSHRTREHELCSSGAEEGDRLSDQSRLKPDRNQSPSSHFNSISPSPISAPTNQAFVLCDANECFNPLPDNEQATFCNGEQCSAIRAHNLRHFPIRVWRCLARSKPSDQKYQNNHHKPEADLTTSRVITACRSCNAFLTLPNSKADYHSPLNHCNIVTNDDIEPTDRHLDYSRYIDRRLNNLRALASKHPHQQSTIKKFFYFGDGNVASTSSAASKSVALVSITRETSV